MQMMLEKFKKRCYQLFDKILFKMLIRDIERVCNDKGMQKVTYSDGRNTGDWCYKYIDNDNTYKIYFSAGYPRVEFLKDIGDLDNNGYTSHRVVGSFWDTGRLDVNDYDHLRQLLQHFGLNNLLEDLEERRDRSVA